jgi:hypothetical protein
MQAYIAAYHTPEGGIDDAIAALVNVDPTNEVDISKIDELNQWRRYEPAGIKSSLSRRLSIASNEAELQQL